MKDLARGYSAFLFLFPAEIATKVLKTIYINLKYAIIF